MRNRQRSAFIQTEIEGAKGVLLKRNAGIEGQILRVAELSELSLQAMVITKCQMQGSIFRDTILHETEFHSTDLSNATFDECIANSAVFYSCLMRHCTFEDANISECDFTESELAWSSFEKAYATRTLWGNADLEGASFDGANLTLADFRGADLTSTDFEKANLSRADFTGATINDARFDQAKLDGVKGLFYMSVPYMSSREDDDDTLFAVDNIKRNGHVMVKSGCWYSTLDDFEIRVRETKGADSLYQKIAIPALREWKESLESLYNTIEARYNDEMELVTGERQETE